MELIEILKNRQNQEKGALIMALLPLLWIWLPVMTYYRDKKEIVKSCLYSGLNTFLFLGITALNFLISLISWHGEVISWFLQILNVILYVGISGFLIYLQSKNGSIEFKPFDRIVEKQLIRLDGRP